MSERYRSEFHASIHEMMLAAHRMNAVDDVTMADFSRRCLVAGDHIETGEANQKDRPDERQAQD